LLIYNKMTRSLNSSNVNILDEVFSVVKSFVNRPLE
jgi:hypothetical protein